MSKKEEYTNFDLMPGEWWDALIERDVAWEQYCKYPTDATWKLYEDAQTRLNTVEATV